LARPLPQPKTSGIQMPTETTLLCADSIGASAAQSQRKWRLIAVVATAAVYLFGVSNTWEPSPDSALYLSLARSLADGEGYSANCEPSNTVTPGLPWMLSGLRLALGQAHWPGNLLSAMCGLGVLALVYAAMRRWTDPPIALIIACATAASYPFYVNSHRILTDVPLALLFWAMICFCMRFEDGHWGWLIAAAAAAVAGITVRAPGVLLIGPMSAAVAVMGRRRRRAIIGAAILCACTLGTMGAFYLLASSASSRTPLYVQGSIGSFNSSNRIGQLVPGLLELPLAVSELFTSQDGNAMLIPGVLLIALMCIGGYALWRRGHRWPAIVLAPYPVLLILLGGWQSIRARYLLPAFPLMIALCFIGAAVISHRVSRLRPSGHNSSRRAMIVCMVLGCLIIASNLPKTLRQAYRLAVESRKEGYYHKYQPRHGDTMDIARMLRLQAGGADAVAAPEDCVAILHYLCGLRIDAIPADGLPDSLEHVIADRPAVRFVVLESNDPIPPALVEVEPIHKGKRLKAYRIN